MPAEKHLTFTLRLPEDLHAQLTAIAKREGRSLNSQILQILRKAVADGEPG